MGGLEPTLESVTGVKNLESVNFGHEQFSNMNEKYFEKKPNEKNNQETKIKESKEGGISAENLLKSEIDWDCVDDSLNAIESKDLVTPCEICLNVELSSLYGCEQLNPHCIVDTGAGRSYLIINKDDEKGLAQLPLSRLEGKWMVQFADNKRQEVRFGMKASLTVTALDMERDFKREVTLLILKSEDNASGMHLLFGRDLISEFGLQLDGTTRAWINGHLVFEAGDLVINRVEDQVCMVQGTQKLVLNIEGEDDREIFFEQDEFASSEPEPQVVRPLDLDFEEEPGGMKFRAQISIPWLGEARPAISYQSTRVRDRKIWKNLSKEQLQLYSDAVEQLQRGGFAEQIPDSEPNQGHYIAVRPVFKSGRTTTKCRLCLDARELNKYMSSGPQNGVKMLDALLLFRATPLVATFDLTKAFWQIKLQESERKFFSTVIMGKRYRFTRMVFGGNFSPAGLETAIRIIKQKAIDHLQVGNPMEPGEPTRPETASCVNYIDDFHVPGNGTMEELRVQVTWIRWFFERYGFPSDKLRFNGRDADTAEPYLSYRWHEKFDWLMPKLCELQEIPEREPCNRKRLVSAIMKLYDPFGFRLRLQLAGRMLIRECAQENRNGDKSNPWKLPVSRELRAKLNEWIRAVNLTNYAEREKRYVNCETVYCFCDASFTAWCCQFHGSDFELLFAKGGLIQSGFTVPKAELTAVYCGLLQVMELPLKQMGCKSVLILSDNEPTIHRLRNKSLDKTLKAYELNRVRKTRQLVGEFRKKFGNAIQIVIRHIEGATNPADFATRPYPLLVQRPTIDHRKLRAAVTNTEAKFYSGEEPDQPESLNGWDGLMYMTLRSATRRARQAVQPDITTDNMEVLPGDPPWESDTTEIEGNQEQSTDELVEPPLREETTGESPELTKRKQLIAQIIINQRALVAGPDTFRNDDNLWCDLSGKVIIDRDDEAMTKELLDLAHLPHHGGIHVTKYNLRHYKWKRLSQDVTRYVEACPVCSLVRIPRIVRSAVGTVPWNKVFETLGPAGIVGIDICELSTTQNKVGFLTITCAVTKWIRATAISNLSAAEVCGALRSVFEGTMFPRVIVSDGGSCFKARLFSEFCREHSILQLMSPHYASAYNGWYERPHQSILSQLRLLAVDHPDEAWPELLSTAVHLVNTRPYDLSDASGLTPLHLVYANSKFTSNLLELDELDAETKATIKQLGIDHMLRVIPEKIEALGDQARNRRQSAIQKYMAIFERKRDNIRARLLETLGEDPEREFPVGSWVRVYRPPTSKIGVAYSEPRKIVEAPSQATRLVEKVDGKRVLEYVANLTPSSCTILTAAPSVP